MTRDEDVIADHGTARVGPSPYGTYMMNRAIGANLGIRMHPDHANVRYQQTRSDFRIGVQVDERHKRKELLGHRKQNNERQPAPLALIAANLSLYPIKDQGPESFRTPTAVAMLPKPGKIGTQCSPCRITGPQLHCLWIVLHRALVLLRITCRHLTDEDCTQLNTISQ